MEGKGGRGRGKGRRRIGEGGKRGREGEGGHDRQLVGPPIFFMWRPLWYTVTLKPGLGVTQGHRN